MIKIKQGIIVCLFALSLYSACKVNHDVSLEDQALDKIQSLENLMETATAKSIDVAREETDNSFPNWPAYNKLIGLGGWGDRNEKYGPYVYYNNEGKLIRDNAKGKAGSHGPQHEFPITVRQTDHPITKGMPEVWMTTQDECYAMLRGPAENMTVLATGKDQSEKAPTDRHEPVLMVIDYGKGRIFHTTLGHADYSIEGVGFIVSFLRGVEWAATGKVTQAIPQDFPTADKAISRKFKLKN